MLRVKLSDQIQSKKQFDVKLIKSLTARSLTVTIFFAGCGGGESKATHAGSFGA